MHDAAVGEDGGGGEVTGGVAGEKGDDIGDFLGAGQAAKGNGGV